MAIGCILQAGLREGSANLKADVFHQSVYRVPRVLKKVHLVSGIPDSYLTDFSGCCFGNQTVEIALNLRPEGVVLDCLVQTLLNKLLFSLFLLLVFPDLVYLLDLSLMYLLYLSTVNLQELGNASLLGLFAFPLGLSLLLSHGLALLLEWQQR